jgi:hypothetical protein
LHDEGIAAVKELGLEKKDDAVEVFWCVIRKTVAASTVRRERSVMIVSLILE